MVELSETTDNKVSLGLTHTASAWFAAKVRLGALVPVVLLLSCQTEDPGPGLVGSWEQAKLIRTSCSDPTVNLDETCTGCGLGTCSQCVIWTFTKGGRYTMTNVYGQFSRGGRYTVTGNMVYLIDSYGSGDYEFTVASTTLTLIQRNWPVYTGNAYAYCTETRTYTRQ